MRFGAHPPGLGRAALVAAVADALADPVATGATVVVAVSGGPDSTALLHLVAEARQDLECVAGHVRHGLRDDSADARAAAGHAAALGLAVRERSVQVTATGEGVEADARRARYAALSALAREVEAAAVLTGHTADDQAETVLLNIARGAGTRGVAGMPAVRPLEAGGPLLVRPLLRVRRSDVRRFVDEEGLSAVADPTNRDLRRRRNRARSGLLPRLGALSGGTGDPVGVLTRLADLARQDAETLDALAEAEARRRIERWGAAAAVRHAGVLELPAALATRLVRRLVDAVRGEASGVTAEAVAAILSLEAGGAAELAGGITVTCGGGWLAAVPARIEALAERPVAVPGQTPLPELGLVLHADPLATAGPTPPGESGGGAVTPPGASGPAAVVLPRDAGPLVVRSRHEGERITLRGGTRKLQDVFVDAGVPRALRHLVPVVAGRDGTVWWVPGLARREVAGTPRLRLWLAGRDPADGALGSDADGGRRVDGGPQREDKG